MMKNTKRTARAMLIAILCISVMTVFAFAADNFEGVVAPIVSLLNTLVKPLLLLVGAAGTLYCVLLGVKYAKAEEPQEREKAKSHLKNAIIGFVLIFVLILALNLLMDPLINWVNSNAGKTVIG